MLIQLNHHKIYVHQEALSVMEVFTQAQKDQPEAGGIVLGKVKKDTIHVLKLSPPTELDKASRRNFERHRLSAQIVINHEFYNSHQQMTYLGEWHTHPEDFPSPSGTDKKMIAEQFRTNKFHTPFLLLFIKGLKGLYVAVFEDDELTSCMIKV